MSTRQDVSQFQGQDRLGRREFMAGAAAAALSYAVLKPAAVRAAQAKPVRLGLIGCGGRGTWIADLFKAHGGYEIVAAADYFQDKVDTFGERFAVPTAQRFTGLSGSRRLLECGVDAVAIESPPYFHPAQAAAAVDAGAHVYLAKPIAVDVPGCNTIQEAGKKASQKKQVFLVDFQTRATQFYIEAIKRVHAGAIGELAFGQSTYHAESPWPGQMQFLRDNPQNPENQLRAWGLSRALSGDIIVEQNVHALDVASWIVNQPPLYADAAGGLTVRERIGSCYDHYAALYQFPNGVEVTFSSRQFPGHASQPDGIRNRFFGSKGVLETQYGGQVFIRGENFYRGGRTPGIYTEGAQANIATFHDAITKGRFDNPTVEPSVRSTLVALLGRTAAYAGRRLLWTDLLKDQNKLVFDTSGLKD